MHSALEILIQVYSVKHDSLGFHPFSTCLRPPVYMSDEEENTLSTAVSEPLQYPSNIQRKRRPSISVKDIHAKLLLLLSLLVT